MPQRRVANVTPLTKIDFHVQHRAKADATSDPHRNPVRIPLENFSHFVQCPTTKCEPLRMALAVLERRTNYQSHFPLTKGAGPGDLDVIRSLITEEFPPDFCLNLYFYDDIV